MLISLIVARSENGVIGRDNGLPWHLPADLKHFKAVTMGKPIVMGRKTHESIGRPLPGRPNIVLSRDPAFEAPGCAVVRTLDEALEHGSGADEIVVIGGEAIYRDALPRTDRIYLTEVHAHVEGDVRFPDINPAEWREASREHHAAGESEAYGFSFVVLERRRVPEAAVIPKPDRGFV